MALGPIPSWLQGFHRGQSVVDVRAAAGGSWEEKGPWGWIPSPWSLFDRVEFHFVGGGLNQVVFVAPETTQEPARLVHELVDLCTAPGAPPAMDVVRELEITPILNRDDAVSVSLIAPLREDPTKGGWHTTTFPTGQLDVDALRADTPGCTHHVHFNNAGASLPTAQVTQAVTSFLEDEARIGGYEIAEARAEEIGRYRPALAELLGVQPGEIAFAPNDTLAFATTLWGLVHTGAIPAGSKVVVDRTCYVSHYLALLQVRRAIGVELVVAPSDGTGALDPDGLRACVDGAAAVSLTHVGTHRGLVNPVAEAGAVIRAHSDALFLLDACQSVGQLPVDLGAIGCDVATATGRKFLRGPRGSGLLYVRDEVIPRVDPVGLDGRGARWLGPERYEAAPDARRFEPYELAPALQVGLGVAVDVLLELGVDAVAARIAHLAETLRDALREAGAQVHDGGHQRCGIVTFTWRDEASARSKARLAEAGIAVSTSDVGSARLDRTGPDDPQVVVRASVHAYNTEDEVQTLVAALEGAG